MKSLQHRVGVSEANLVFRKLKLVKLDQNNYASLYTEIDNIFGVDDVNLDSQTKQLSIAYDATHCNLAMIEKIMAKYGVFFANSWWNRLKVSYYKFVDQNLQDNANHQATCCHHAPPGANKKR